MDKIDKIKIIKFLRNNGDKRNIKQLAEAVNSFSPGLQLKYMQAYDLEVYNLEVEEGKKNLFDILEEEHFVKEVHCEMHDILCEALGKISYNKDSTYFHTLSGEGFFHGAYYHDYQDIARFYLNYKQTKE